MPKTSNNHGISREEAAAEVLTSWEETQYSLRRTLTHYSKEKGLTNWQIRTAIHSLVFETMRRLNTIDHVLNSVLKKTTINDLDPITRNVLRVSTYMILFGEGIAPLVTNEAVTILKRVRNQRIAGFANAVLRKIQHTDLNEILASTPEPKRTEIKFSVPYWLVEYAERILGPEEARQYLSSGLENPSIYIRVNTFRSKIDDARHDLEKEEFHCSQSSHIPEMLKLQGGNKPVTQTDLYLQNAIYLQSLSSALVSHVLHPQTSAIVVDLCAAPGSKTAHLAQLMKNHGNIIAFDNILFRVQELIRNITRLGVRNTHVLLTNSFDPPLRKEFHADYVLIDPPCSNTGVIQTRPEVKWHITPDLIRRIRSVQLTLLKQGANLVAPDGYAVYSTCSITLEENEKLIRKFLTSNPDFELVAAEPQMGTEGLEGLVKCQRLYPHKNDTEGFFIAKLHRKPKFRS